MQRRTLMYDCKHTFLGCAVFHDDRAVDAIGVGAITASMGAGV